MRNVSDIKLAIQCLGQRDTDLAYLRNFMRFISIILCVGSGHEAFSQKTLEKAGELCLICNVKSPM